VNAARHRPWAIFSLTRDHALSHLRRSPACHLAAPLAILPEGRFAGLILLPKRESTLARELFTARLARKDCLSASAQCFHLEFVLDELESFPFTAGQFVSVVAEDPQGKQQTRAYSLASAPSGNRFDLCLNRVEGGFVSNRLAELAVGETIQLQRPLGYFTLREPITDSILIATGTGVAPMRGFAQWLFPADGPDAGTDRSGGKEIWLVYGTRHESELYYREEFEALAARHANFHYLPTLSRAPESWTGLRGYVQEHAARVIEERAARLGRPLPAPPPDPSIPPAELRFDIHAYICGLNHMVSAVRERLKSLGWHRRQIVFERYD
jgi:ferredoxin-NADP reductase